jgi:hypothetical protein
MRLTRTIPMLAVLVLGAAIANSALAQHRGSGGGGGYRGYSGHGGGSAYSGGGGYRGYSGQGGYGSYRGAGAYGGYRGYGGYGAYRGHGTYYRHGHSHIGVGVYFGGPWWYYPYPSYYPPYAYPYYYPPAYSEPPYPTEYVERESAPAAPQRADPYWYFCPESNAYYPYVKQCPGGWQRVAPSPPPGSGGTER